MKWKFFSIILLVSLGALACSATRKISKVGLREPSSTADNELRDSVTVARSRLSAMQDSPRSCPKDFSKSLSQLAIQKVTQTHCPERLAIQVQTSLNMLTMEERSFLEELVGVQCQGLIHGQQDDTLLNFIENYDSTGPIGRRRQIIESFLPQQNDYQTLKALKESLNEIVLVNFPMERWVLRHGKFILPEVDLDFLLNLVQTKACRIENTDFEMLYRIQQSAEDLLRMIAQEKQREDLFKFVEILHQITDNKVKEFFNPK